MELKTKQKIMAFLFLAVVGTFIGLLFIPDNLWRWVSIGILLAIIIACSFVMSKKNQAKFEQKHKKAFQCERQLLDFYAQGKVVSLLGEAFGDRLYFRSEQKRIPGSRALGQVVLEAYINKDASTYIEITTARNSLKTTLLLCLENELLDFTYYYSHLFDAKSQEAVVRDELTRFSDDTDEQLNCDPEYSEFDGYEDFPPERLIKDIIDNINHYAGSVIGK